MKKFILLLLFIATYNTAIKAQETVEFILRLDSIKKNYLVPKFSPETDTYSIPDNAIDSYIQQFDKLRFKKKTKVKCLYVGNGGGRRPFLYIHRLNDDAFRKKKKSASWFQKHAAKNFVEPIDDSPMAYFQYLIFREYGEQFALFWHELYGIKTVHAAKYLPARAKNREEAERMAKEVIDEEISIIKAHPEDYSEGEFDFMSAAIKEIESLFEYYVKLYMNPTEISVFGKIINEELNREFTEKEIAPKITMDIDWCVITLFEENHNYLTQKTYKVQRKRPWKIELAKESLIVEKPAIVY